MMRTICLCLCLSFGMTAFGQTLKSFSEDKTKFLNELDDFINANKRKDVEEIYDQFKKDVLAGRYNDEQFVKIQGIANTMLVRKMRATPYFQRYLETLNTFHNQGLANKYLDSWIQVTYNYLVELKSSKLRDYSNYMAFCKSFLKDGTLRSVSSGGVYWRSIADNFTFQYEEGKISVTFDELDIIGGRKRDSISINKTMGTYYPLENVWKGTKGQVDWSNTALGSEIYCVLGDYKIDTKKTSYTSKEVTFYHPTFFTGPIKGKFTDKIVANSNKNDASYPRFESFDNNLKISNIGDKIKYVGGFSLQGVNVIGSGNETRKAQMFFYDQNNRLAIRTAAATFTIRKNENIYAKNVDASIYFEEDSIYHPNIEFRFVIPTRVLSLTRTGTGNSQILFYNSYHEVEMDVERIGWQIDSDSIEIGQQKMRNVGGRPTTAVFESLDYYDERTYRRLQNIDNRNPITMIKRFADKKQPERLVDANELAKYMNPRYSLATVTPLLVTLVEKGFIYFDKEKETVYIKDKIYHYSDASIKKVDYDIIKATSTSKRTNGILNLKDNSMTINGVPSVIVSDSQLVALKPIDGNITMGKNRNINYNGRAFAGYGIFDGKEFHLDYEKFKLNLDSIKFFELRIPDPEGAVDRMGDPILVSLGTKIEDTSGEVIIDYPDNKSSREMFDELPIFRTLSDAYVYYDSKATQGGKYSRDKFYFKIAPFEIDSLDAFDPAGISFDGELNSAGIFPELDEKLEVQNDLSLGLNYTTEPTGLPMYEGKGQYVGDLILNNEGLKGEGDLSYLTTNLNSENFLFLPNQMLANVELFELKEQRAPVEFPKVTGEDVSVDWRPYKDSMYITTAEKAFALFGSDYNLTGQLILTPGGLYGNGVLDWTDATMSSKAFRLGFNGFDADTSSLKIKQLGGEAAAFSSRNVKAAVDFDSRVGKFVSNTNTISTTLPSNKYRTSMDEFEWSMDGHTIDFKTKEGKATFLSIHEDQDSLKFVGESANYNLETNLLKVEKVPFIRSADAFIYPKDGKVEVITNAVIKTLEDAVIIADTSNKYHTINKAVVNVLGKNNYTASGGFYEYNVGDYKQDIKFDKIEIIRERKGPKKGNYVTIGAGRIPITDNFYLDEKTFYHGKFKLKADKKTLNFKGYAKLNSPHIKSDSAWFSINGDIDRNNVIINYDEPRNLKGDKLYTGIRVYRDTGSIYPVIMNNLRSRRDRGIFQTKGIVKYDKEKDYFYFGDSMKIVNGDRRGNLLEFNRKSGKIDVEGKFNLMEKLDYVMVEGAGTGEISLDGENTNFDMMLALTMIVPDKLMNLIIKDVETNGAGLSDIDYSGDYVQKALPEFVKDEKELGKVEKELTEFERLYLPKALQEKTFFFSNVNLQWNPKRESLINTKPLGIAYIGGKALNRTMKSYIELRMSRSRDELNIYLESPSGEFYYFNYRTKVLSAVSSDPTFNDTLLALKKDEYQFKMGDGDIYEVRPTGLNAAKFFLKRVKN